MRIWEMMMVDGTSEIVLADSRADVFARYPQAYMVWEISVT